VEFGSSDAMKAFLKESKKFDFKSGDNKLKVKPARTKIKKKRSYSIRKAEELIKASGHSMNKDVKIVWKSPIPRSDMSEKMCSVS